MKLYLRHIFNSIKLKPIQPLLIIITIMMSVVLFVVAYVEKDIIDDCNLLAKQCFYGDSDICITVNSNSDVSFMQISDVTDVIGENDTVWGYYKQSMVAHIGDDNVLSDVIAADFTNSGYLMQFDFSEKGDINYYNRNDVLIVSTTFARDNSVKIGDEIIIDIGMAQKKYTVQGIAKETGMFWKIGIMLNVESIVHLVAEDIGVYILDYDFIPYNNVLIKLNDPDQWEETIAKLSQEDAFADKTILYTKDYTQAYDLTQIENMFILIFFALISALAVCFIYSTFSIASSKRLYSNAMFRSMGASKPQMYFMSVIEAVLYAVAGTLLGLPISTRALAMMQIGLDIPDIQYELTVEIGIYALIFAVAVAVLSVTVSSVKTLKLSLDTMLKGETKFFHLPSFVPVIVLSALFVAGIPVFFFIKPTSYYIPAVVLSVILVVLFIFVLPYISKGVMSGIDALLNKRKTKGLLSIVVKNTHRNLTVQNLNRVLMLVIAFFIVMQYAISFANYTIDVMVDVIKPEVYVQYVFGMDSTEILDLEEMNEVENVTSIYTSSFCYLDNGQKIPVYVIDGNASDVIEFEKFNYEYTEQLQGNEILIPECIAVEFGKKIGDELNINIQDNVNTYIIKDTIDTNYNFIVTTREGAGVICDLLLIDIADGYDVDDAIIKIKTVLSDSTVIIKQKGEIKASLIEGIDSFLNLGNTILAMVMFLSVIAVIDSLVESYQTRQKEFTLLRQAGMSKKKLSIMLLLENAVNLLITSAIGVFLAWAMLKVISLGLLSYGVNFNLW